MKTVRDRNYGNTKTEEWGDYMEAKKRKLKEQFKEGISELIFTEEEGSKIFQGISIFVNGYTIPPANELRRLMMLHGGTYHHYYSRKLTTHIIATNLPYSKIRELKDEKVIKPEWIMDSIKARELLPACNYVLYSPSSRGQKTLDFSVKSARNTSNINEQHKKNFHSFSKVQKADMFHENIDSEVKGNSSLEQMEDNAVVKKVCNSVEECLNTEIENCESTTINQVEEFCSETSKNVQISIDGSESRKHKQLPCFIQSHHNEQSPPLRAGAPNFISEFYNHSRLHHISTAKSNFQIYVTELRNCKNKCFTGREKLKELFHNNVSSCASKIMDVSMTTDGHPGKIFMHIDMDCFFASVSLLKYPHLKDNPVAVTHSKTGMCRPLRGSNMEYEQMHYKALYLNTKNEQISNDEKIKIDSEVSYIDNAATYCGSASEIASCNYHARKYGVHNGMFVGEAKKLCPELQMIPYDFEGYETVSKLLYDIIASYTLDIQAVSCDEVYIDCTNVLAETKVPPLWFASVLRREIEEKTGCTASAGLGSNLLLARLATKTAKPNGQYFIEPHFSEEIMKQQLVKDLPGIGYIMESRLKEMGIITCEDLQNLSLGKLQNEFGMKTGKMFFDYCRGIDFREIKIDNKRKSVSAEINYGMRFQQLHEVKSFLKQLAEEVQTRLQKINMRGKSVTLKLKIRKDNAPVEPAKFMGHGICDNITKTLQLGSATNNSVAIGRACIVLLQNLKLVKPVDIRGLGIKVGRLEELFEKDSDDKQLLLKFIQKTDTCDSIGKKESSSLSPLKLKIFENNRSFSEIDPEVFAALPDELRHEIMEYYNSNNIAVVKDVAHPQQTCIPTSSAANINRKSLMSSTERNIESKCPLEYQQLYLPNFSQIDHSVFTALPNELKYEIMGAYSNKEGTKKVSPHEMHSSANVLTSLLKQSPKSKNVKSNESPVSKLTKGYKQNIASPKQSLSKWNDVIHEVAQKSTCVQNEINSYRVKETKQEAESCNEPNLCGAITIDEVKDLLIEWVSSSETPEEEDITLFSHYIVDITMEKNLEKLNRIIKYFYRLVKKTGNVCWQKSYLDLITIMQSTMLQIYGSTLKIETEF